MSKLIPSLNGLRALSIIAVLFSHAQERTFHLPFSYGGPIGVNIFFVISGFLITLLLIKEEETNGTISLKDFFIRRSLRIFPVYFLLLLVYFLLQNLHILSIPQTSWISSLTYTRYFFKGEWETGHLWSLSVEEHFYLVWPFVFVYLTNKRVFFAWAVVLIVPLVRLFSEIAFMNHMFTRGDALMWGCLFAIYYKPLSEFIKNKHTILLFVPFATLLFCLAIKKTLHVGNDSALHYIIQAYAGSYGMLTNISVGFIILISIKFKNNLYFSFLNSKAMNYLGMLSYSIYIWQQLFFSNQIGIFSSFPYNICLIFMVAMFSYHFIEKPFLRLKPRFIVAKPELPLAPLVVPV
jgi:peptidoglycan/LPS O-acetylase OafA/YrhL